jgi:hypothetical protein
LDEDVVLFVFAEHEVGQVDDSMQSAHPELALTKIYPYSHPVHETPSDIAQL